MAVFINRYSAQAGIADSLTNTRAQTATEDEVHQFMLDAKDIPLVDKFISFQILLLDPNNQPDDAWYAYHRTLEAIADGLDPAAPGDGIEPIYSYDVTYAAAPADGDYGPFITPGRTANTLNVRGTQAEIQAEHDALIVAGAWRDFWHDPVANPEFPRPVYEDTYTVQMWKQDRPVLVNDWGAARQEKIYPSQLRRIDNEVLILSGQQVTFELFQALNNATQTRMDLQARELLVLMRDELDTKISVAKTVYDTPDRTTIYQGIYARKEAGLAAYTEVTGDIIPKPMR